MPWTSVPFGSPVKEQLGTKFGVRGIPTFVILDEAGNTVDRDGRNTVMTAKGNTAAAMSKWIS
jgi:hypothetical protein